jgi:hypothetical protein
MARQLFFDPALSSCGGLGLGSHSIWSCPALGSVSAARRWGAPLHYLKAVGHLTASQ